jgi:hypothetical protein
MAVSEGVQPGAGGHAKHHRDLAELANDLDDIVTRGRLSPTELEALVSRIAGTGASLQNHVNAETPHPAYDDIPSMRLIFENGIV